MSTRSVTVLTVHGRRMTVKVEPGTTVLEILEKVCRKFHFPLEEYDLTHYNRVLDLSAMFRFSGLPNNATLEMTKAKRVRVETDVTIQLQCEDGERRCGSFKPSFSLLEVLQTLCPERANAESRPLMIYMRREVFWPQLGETSLKSLGLTSGRAIIRLLQREPEELKTQANVSAPLPQTKHVSLKADEATLQTIDCPKPEFPELPELPESTVPVLTTDADCSATTSISVAGTEDTGAESGFSSSTNQPQTNQQLAETNPTPTVPAACLESLEMKLEVLGTRDAVLYHADTIVSDQPNAVDDSFFELSIPEVMQMYKQLQQHVKELEDAPLMLGEDRLRRGAKITETYESYRRTLIRVQFPDRYILQGVFGVNEKVSDVEEFVRSFLTDPTTPFYLYTTPPKQVLEPDSTMIAVRCIPKALLYFSGNCSPTDGSYLKDEFLSRLSNAAGASYMVKKFCLLPSESGGAKKTVKSILREEMAKLQEENQLKMDSQEAANVGKRLSNSDCTPSTSHQHGGASQLTEREAKLLKWMKK
ncbi:tether containing UBX domain for GLUT4 [Anopheles bellator]|uniref:tether containing UBX domain for GLUT4 n=1 Tax=Anopheles bellator TaxID=139047 RepID=UPI0026485587|nr:tether containing UBX domain for GLUT4 [Anopheles bellator]